MVRVSDFRFSSVLSSFRGVILPTSEIPNPKSEIRRLGSGFWIWDFGFSRETLPAMTHDSTDSNLLFGVLALQADLLDANRFAEACSAWAGRKDTCLADLLVERGWITTQDKLAVERLVQLKLQKHAGNLQASLAAVAGPDVQRVLAD